MESKELPPRTPASAHSTADLSELSEREREILILVAGGASNKEVAQRLVISPNTVKVHLRNIFGKVGVSSRTEAALYAVRAGLVRVAVEPPPGADAEAQNGAAEVPSVIPVATPAPVPQTSPSYPRLRPAVWLTGAALLTLVVVATVFAVYRLLPAASNPPAATSAPTATHMPRWEVRTAMPTARQRLAAVVYENQIYAIGGEAGGAVTGAAERYDPAADAWSALAPKPQPVADVGAAVLGGLLYVPGGRLATGQVTARVEAYDPVADKWSARAPLPVALSGYALAAFEGRLYLFGGWNGTGYVASVYEYDPTADAWAERTRMPTARGFAAAAVSGGQIYVVGGTDARGASRAIETYVPARDSEVANPWQTLAQAPASLSTVAATTIADTLYVTGRDASDGSFAAWEFRPEQGAWRPLEPLTTAGFAPDWLSLVAVHTNIYLLASPPAASAPAQFLAYQALYTNLIPVVTTGE